MTETAKTPQREQWWIRNSDGKIVYIIGHSRGGRVIFEDADGWVDYLGDEDWSDWHHEPRCDGFDWVEPPADVWPKWVISEHDDACDVYRADSWDRIVWCEELTGREVVQTDPAYYKRKWHEFTPITEAEAKARLNSPTVEPPAVDPGEGYRLLEKGEVLQDGDECKQDGYEDLWYPTVYAGNAVGKGNTCGFYRRKIEPAEPAETFPQCWSIISPEHWPALAYVRKTSPTEYVVVDKYGTDGATCRWDDADNKYRTRLTDEQAAALLTPKESPDDWVEITDQEHVLRAKDQVFRIQNATWENVSTVIGMKVCKIGNSLDQTRFRCRRKDLPQLTPAPKRVPVRLWREHCSGNVIATINQDDDPIDLSDECDEIMHDADGFYVVAEQ